MLDPPEDPAWQKLYREICQHVELEKSDITLARTELTWYRVSNPDVLLERAVSSGGRAEEMDPFWAATWRAALGLDAYLQDMDLKGAQILELGCGSGQAGCSAAMQGACVTMTDSVRIALQVAQLNSWHVHNSIRYTQLIWAEDRLDDRFPIIMGSDLVYDPNLFPALESTARQHLQPGGVLLLSEPHRHTGDRFSQWIREAGWHTEEQDIDLQDQRVPIRIFACRIQEE